MGSAGLTRWPGDGEPTRGDIEREFRALRLAANWWSNGPGESYAAHTHAYHKVLFCAQGAITFRLEDGTEHELRAGDRLDIPAGLGHSAVVGAHGVTCAEAAKR